MSANNEKNGHIFVISRNVSNNTIDIPAASQENLVPIKTRSTKWKQCTIDKKVTVLFILVILLAITLLVVSISYASANQKTKSEICESDECLRSAANLAMSMDKESDPCVDFYSFTCGRWSDEHPKPDSSASYDWFSDRQNKVLRSVREFLLKNNTKDDPLPVIQARDMYTACTDTDTIDELGFEPIYEFLKKVGLPKVPNYFNITQNEDIFKFDWLKVITNIKREIGKDVFIGFSVLPDSKNKTVNRLCLGTPDSSSPLPSNVEMEKRLRKLILNSASAEEIDDNESISIYNLYVQEVMRSVIGEDLIKNSAKVDKTKIENAARAAVNVSKSLYRLTKEPNDTLSNSVEPIYLTVNEIQKYTNQYVTFSTDFPKDIWKQYILNLYKDIENVTLKLDTTDKILMDKYELEYLGLLSAYLAKTPQILLELYMWWVSVETLIVHTTTEMQLLKQKLSHAITSIETSEARSIYCANAINNFMGMAVSYSIANKTFLTDTKPKVKQMIDDIQNAFRDIVKSVDWMDSATKKATMEKCDNMQSFIGFPEWLYEPGEIEKYYYGLTVSTGQYLKTLLDFCSLEMKAILYSLRDLNENDWATIPTNVNAFHTFQSNAITIPLAILQYPFYNLGLEALNYGAIGTILGHELTHGFDDNGRQFDKNGNLLSWWTNKTINEYVNRTECFINQYSSYYIPELKEHIDGENTLGENIADNIGLREAYRAYQQYRQRNGIEKLLPGFEQYTHDQLLFIAYGNIWCETTTTTSLKWSLEDVHCPGKIRLHGSLANSNEFSEAFNCPKGSPMNPEKSKCKLW